MSTMARRGAMKTMEMNAVSRCLPAAALEWESLKLHIHPPPPEVHAGPTLLRAPHSFVITNRTVPSSAAACLFHTTVLKEAMAGELEIHHQPPPPVPSLSSQFSSSPQAALLQPRRQAEAMDLKVTRSADSVSSPLSSMGEGEAMNGVTARSAN
ncbi:hypothetical protein E2562_030106 [Oryza meyeriana var. granulata]|uniref:Uncharacterized protein n=1 Tax=Oryza meyeriana var. granulata TaxID=110450 RepID=A0A6G1CVP9_9ORYZ|nr:hypothetical protein E2562_030106 [Oryza meyeriana var. granulata]